jgi:hypothetical protein
MSNKIFIFFILIALIGLPTQAQQQADTLKQVEINEKILSKLTEEASKMEQALNKGNTASLQKLKKKELKLRAKLWKKDSTLAKKIFPDIEGQYQAIQNTKVNLTNIQGDYSAKLDSLTAGLNFLKGAQIKSSPEIDAALSKYKNLQKKLKETEEIKKFLASRQKQLKSEFEKFGMVSQIKGFQKEIYYYAEKIKGFKKYWEEPSKIETELLLALKAVPEFSNFFAKHSIMGSIFPVSPSSSFTGQGIQNRASVVSNIISRFGSQQQAVQNLSSSLGAATEQLNILKNRPGILSTGSLGSDTDFEVPKGFKPNGQRNKTFFQRLEVGFNFQTQKNSSLFPATSDLGFSLGYKLNDNNSVGLGLAYKIGLGKNWDEIKFTSRGIGIRSFIDFKIKKSIYITGGYEKNYQSDFKSITQLQNVSGWQNSGLIGLSKKFSVSKKIKGDVKLLWDFLSYNQIPRTKPILFRIGYIIK